MTSELWAAWLLLSLLSVGIGAIPTGKWIKESPWFIEGLKVLGWLSLARVILVQMEIVNPYRCAMLWGFTAFVLVGSWMVPKKYRLEMSSVLVILMGYLVLYPPAAILTIALLWVFREAGLPPVVVKVGAIAFGAGAVWVFKSQLFGFLILLLFGVENEKAMDQLVAQSWNRLEPGDDQPGGS